MLMSSQPLTILNITKYSSAGCRVSLFFKRKSNVIPIQNRYKLNVPRHI